LFALDNSAFRKLLEFAAEHAGSNWGAAGSYDRRTAQLAISARSLVQFPKNPHLVLATGTVVESKQRTNFSGVSLFSHE
jgi:hypothetical protein